VTALRSLLFSRKPDLKTPLRLVSVGVLGIFGGETFCLIGPLRYERIVHLTCHAVLYAGIALVFVGGLLRWRGKNNTRNLNFE
jgi:hypothetical protein